MSKAIQFGAGNIGRGFIGALLESSGYNVIFADVNQEIIDKINKDKFYTVHIMDISCSEQIVKNISAINSTSEEIIDELVEAELITTAVGLVILPKLAHTIAKSINIRFKNNIKKYLNIIACENAIKASSQLKEEIYKLLDDNAREYADKYIGFPDCSVDRIVPPVKSDNFIDVVVEGFYEWNVEQSAFKGEIPKIKGMNLANNLMAYIERKLFTLNTGHAITSYIGYLKSYKTVDESIRDNKIYNIVKSAMIESGEGLIKKYNFNKDEHLKYIDKIISRFKNHYLKDEVSRVGREPLRKLSPNDRLVKPFMTAISYNLPVDNLTIGIAAALNYDNKDDIQSIELQNNIKNKGLVNAFSEVSNITDKFLLERIEYCYKNIKNFI